MVTGANNIPTIISQFNASFHVLLVYM